MNYKLDKVERKTTSTGKAKIDATVTTEEGETIEKVGIWSDFPRFADLKEGDIVVGDIVIKDQWKTLYPPKPTNGAGRKPNMDRIMEKKEASIEKFQDNKEEGIKISSTMRDAVACAIAEYNKDPHSLDSLDELIRKWRKFLWFEWDSHADYPPFMPRG